MLSKVNSAAIIGLESKRVEVEVDIHHGLPGILIVGLPSKEVDESKERVRSAIKNIGHSFPSERITVNLAPADLPKTGPAYDLPIAIGILAASEQVPKESLKKCIFIGELSLNGSLRHVNGVLPIVLMAKNKGYKNVFIPEKNRKEAEIVSGINIFAVKNLLELVYHLKDEKVIKPVKYKKIKFQKTEKEEDFDFAYIKGQEFAKRALEIAASGGHNLIMNGPPGSGKTLLARSFPTIMPKMSLDETLEVTKIYSIAGLLSEDGTIVLQRPYRQPHHTASDIALVGGGQHPKPGEITLAHRGVLFLDELPEFNKNVLEVLRQPLEDHFVTIARATATLRFPADFILVAAMNPCPCGFYNDSHKECVCTTSQINKYQKKISGPLLDRIDLCLEIPRVKYQKLTKDTLAEKSSVIRKRVEKARLIQNRRFKNSKFKTNSAMMVKDIKQFCNIDNEIKDFIKKAAINFNLSARSFHKILKISRTIADMESEKNILLKHVAEALQYRPKEN